MTRRLRPLVRYRFEAHVAGQVWATAEAVARKREDAEKLARDRDWHYRFACEHGAVSRVVDEEVVSV